MGDNRLLKFGNSRLVLVRQFGSGGIDFRWYLVGSAPEFRIEEQNLTSS